MQTATELAQLLGADERTLRRAVARGAIHARRPSPRALHLSLAEEEYLRTHWSVLYGLQRALRTEPNVALAVLYGSMARGDDHAGSDIDLLVALRRDSARAATRLALRLEDALRRDVDVARLGAARQSGPLLVVQALREGRVLVDRDEVWTQLASERRDIEREAEQLHRQRRKRAAAVLAEMQAAT